MHLLPFPEGLPIVLSTVLGYGAIIWHEPEGSRD